MTIESRQGWTDDNANKRYGTEVERSRGMESLGDRMKLNYEKRSSYSLLRRTPVIIRLDGRAFHTLTNNCTKPFDERLSDSMIDTTRWLCMGIQGAKLAYTQSDEISILLTDFDELTTQAWFDYDLQKVVSISAGMASMVFTSYYNERGLFDSRAFNIPKEEVTNYFVWRQKDWIRNSVQMLAHSQFSHTQLLNKGQADMHEMLHDKGINWSELEDRWKNGVVVYKDGDWRVEESVIFTQQREIVERYLYPSLPNQSEIEG